MEKEDLIDLEKYLLQERIVLVNDKLTREKGKIILSLMTYLSMVHPIEEERLCLLFLDNCVSGCLRTAIRIHDAIEEMPRPVHTLACGVTASVGSLILVSGHDRTAQRDARILIEEPKWKLKNKKKWRIKGQIFRPDVYVPEIYVKKTGQSYETIQEDLKRTRLMSAKEARHYGIIDHIAL